MDEPVFPLDNLDNELTARADGMNAAPSLLDLATIDTSWGAQAPTNDTDVIQVPPSVWQRLIPQWIRGRFDRSNLDESIDQLATSETEPIEREPEPIWVTGLKTVGAFVASAALAYLVLTFPSQIAKASYLISHIGKSDAASKIVSGSAKSGSFDQAVTPGLSFVPPTVASPTPANQDSPFKDLSDNQLYVPKIDAKAPIIWDSSFEEKAMLDNLGKGVVHYGGTDFPARDRGNVFITGHSSYYWWDSGKYKTIFANLDQMKNGDQAALTYQGNVYVYEVFEKIVVKPTQTDVLNSTDKPILTLMTCTPVGTSLNRLIVKMNLVGVFSEGAGSTPAPATPTPAGQTTDVPKTAPSDSIRLLPGL